MCLHSRRGYTVGSTTAAGAFAAAAVFAALEPPDWAIAEQVDLAVTELVADLDSQRAPAGTPAHVEVVLHANHVELVVAADSPGWATESVRVRPRHPFESDVPCSIEQPGEPPARPVLWPELGSGFGADGWPDVYSALNAIVQTPRGPRRALGPTLDAIADAIVLTTCFSLVAVNLVRPSGDLEVVAVTGSGEAGETLLGTVEPRANWDDMIEHAATWGTLRFASGTAALPSNTVMASWIDEPSRPRTPDGWDTEDSLFAPLYSCGQLVGAISVDLPGGAERPTVDDLRKVELYADHVGVALDRARSPYLVRAADRQR